MGTIEFHALNLVSFALFFGAAGLIVGVDIGRQNVLERYEKPRENAQEARKNAARSVFEANSKAKKEAFTAVKACN